MTLVHAAARKPHGSASTPPAAPSWRRPRSPSRRTVTRSFVFAALAGLLALTAACSDAPGPFAASGPFAAPGTLHLPGSVPRPAPAPEHVRYASVSAGDGFTCGLSTRGAAYCWGDGTKLGSAQPDTTGTPRAVDGGAAFTQVAAGEYTCARTAAGDLYCWGAGSQEPQQMYASIGLRVESVKPPIREYDTGCAIQKGDALVCWPGRTSEVVSVPGQYRDVATASNCVLDESGHVRCAWHEATDVYAWSTFGPRFVGADSLSVFTSISGGHSSACALRSDGAALCSTVHLLGSLGASTQDEFAPVPGGHTFTQVSGGDLRGCGLDATGTAWCWSYIVKGLSGLEYDYRLSTPEQVAGAPAFVQISVGAAHACGVTAAGDAYCWGDNALGQLGGGTRGGKFATPVEVQDAVTPDF